MDSQLRDRWLWSLVLELIRDHDFEWLDNPLEQEKAIFTKPEGDPLDQSWLIRNDGRDYQLVRLQAVDAVWPSMMGRDMRRFADHVPLFRKRLRARSLKVLNVYIFSGFHDDSMTRYFEEEDQVDDQKSTLHHQGVIIREDEGSLQNEVDQIEADPIEADHLDLTLLRIDTWFTKQKVAQFLSTHTLAEIKQEVRQEGKKKKESFYQIFHYGKPYLTFTFLSLNIVIFLFLESVGSSTDPHLLIEYGAKWNPAIVDGEYWRLLTPMFLHIGWLHLAFNSLALFFLGGAVERIYGSFRFLWIYLFAGFTGTLASFTFTANLSAGASGAIFGCFGALLYFGLKHRNLFFRTMGTDVIFIVILNLGIGFAVPMIDNYGHIGGLIGGFLASVVVSLPKQIRWKERLYAVLISAITVPVLLWIGFLQIFHDSSMNHLIEAEVAIQKEEYAQAQQHLQEALDSGMDQPEVYLQLGSVYVYTEQYEKAEETLETAKEKGGDQAELYFQLAYAQVQQEKYEQGRNNLQETISRNPDMMEAYYNLALVYLEQDKPGEAQEVVERALERGMEDEMLQELHEKIVTHQEAA